MVRHSGEPVGEDLRGARVVISDPGDLAAEYLLNSHPEAAVTSAQLADAEPGHAARLPFGGDAARVSAWSRVVRFSPSRSAASPRV